MPTRTGSFTSTSSWQNANDPISIGITLAAGEYPTRVQISGQNSQNCWMNSFDRYQSMTLQLCNTSGGNAVALGSIGLDGGERDWFHDNFGPWDISRDNGLRLKGQALAFSKSAWNGIFWGYGSATVTVTTNYDTYSITVGSATGGSASVSGGATSAQPGTTITMNVSPSTGYRHTGWTSSPAVTITNNRFTMPASAITVTPTFAKISYTITKNVSPAAGGSISGPSSSTYQASVSFTQSPATGYTFQKWRKPDNTETTAQPLTLTMPAGNISITAYYTRNAYAITKVVSPAGAGTIVAPATAGYADTVTPSQTPATGYTFHHWEVTDALISNGSFTMPNGPVTLTAVYTRNVYQITAQVSPAGAGVVTVAGTAGYADQVSISQAATTGYWFDRWTLQGGGSISNGILTMPDGNVTVTANYLRRSVGSLNKSTLQGGTDAILSIASESEAYTHAYQLSFGTNMATGWVDVAAGVTSVTIAIPESWANAIPNAPTKGGGTLTIRTYRGTDMIGTWEIGNLTYQVPEDAVPDVGSITATILRTVDGNSYANVGNIYVQKHCGVTVTVGQGTLKYSATISSTRIWISGYSGNKYDKTLLTNGGTLESGILTESGRTVINVTVTDSRGISTTESTEITVQEYSSPGISTFECWRVDESGNPDDLGEKGQYAYTYTWTQIGSNAVHTELSTQGDTLTDGATSGWLLPGDRKTYSKLLTHQVVLTITDAFEQAQIRFEIGSGKFTLHFSADGSSVAIGHAVSHTPSSGYDGTFEIDEGLEIWYGNMTLKQYIQAVINGTV